MYKEIIKDLDNIEQNPQSGTVGQQQHIKIIATQAKISIDLVNKLSELRKIILNLDQQNDKLIKIMTILTVIGIGLAAIQLIPILSALF